MRVFRFIGSCDFCGLDASMLVDALNLKWGSNVEVWTPRARA